MTLRCSSSPGDVTSAGTAAAIKERVLQQFQGRAAAYDLDNTYHPPLAAKLLQVDAGDGEGGGLPAVVSVRATSMQGAAHRGWVSTCVGCVPGLALVPTLHSTRPYQQRVTQTLPHYQHHAHATA
jgi:hypothetical protein